MVTTRQEIIWIAPKKFQNFLRRLAPLTFLIRFQGFRDPLRGEFPHIQIFMNDAPNPLMWEAQLLVYWFSRNPAVFQDYLVNFIHNILDGHCFWSSRTRWITGWKITMFKLGHTVFDGGIQWCMFLLCFCQNGVNFLRCLALQEKKNLMTDRVSLLLKSRAYLTCFLSASVTRKTCNSAHEQTPLSNVIIDSVLRHRKVGLAKGLSAPTRTYIHT